jgi:hypothetical protein
MATSHARVPTANAADYLLRLSGGLFARTPTLLRDDRRTVVTLPNARCEIVAGAGFLDITLTAASKEWAAALEDLVSDGLYDAARGEELKYQWVLQ